MIPNSTIYICAGVKLRSDQAHTIYFSSAAAQRTYFYNKSQATGGRTFTDYTLTRDNVCYVEATLVDAEWWNYCMIEDSVNDQGMMRKFYFIESVEYIDEQTTALHLKLDVMQTFQHQPSGGYAGNLPSCFVEREHSVYDGDHAFDGGYNTLEEPVDTGEFVTRLSKNICANSWAIVVAATIRLDLLTASSTQSDVVKTYAHQVNGIWSGLGYYYAPLSRSAYVMNVINNLSTLGYIDAIQDIYLFPDTALDPVSGDTSTDSSPFVRLNSSYELDDIANRTALPTQIGSYTPRNKKLLQYPYSFFYVTDSAGMSATYRPEYVHSGMDGYFILTIASNPVSDAGMLIYPTGTYQGVPNNYEAGIMINNYPRIPWSSDQYRLWLAQTANTRRYNLDQATFAHTYKEQRNDLQIAGAMGDAITGGITAILTAGIGGWDQITGAASSMASAALEKWANDKTFQLAQQQMQAQVKDHSITPPQSKGGTSGTLGKLTGTLLGRLQVKTVDDMHARIIDQFFDLYGYQTNSFKVPNIHSRPAWNFVKTAGFDVKLPIPQKYKIALSDCFNAGITFWKRGDQIGDYSQNNAASTPS
jgi:hypothetical protein